MSNFPRSTGFPIGDWPAGTVVTPPVKLILGSDGAWKNPHRPVPREAQVNALKLQEKCDKFMLDGILGKVVKKGKRR